MLTHALAFVEQLLEENPQQLDISIPSHSRRSLGRRGFVRRRFRGRLGHLVRGRHFVDVLSAASPDQLSCAGLRKQTMQLRTEVLSGSHT